MGRWCVGCVCGEDVVWGGRTVMRNKRVVNCGYCPLFQYTSQFMIFFSSIFTLCRGELSTLKARKGS